MICKPFAISALTLALGALAFAAARPDDKQKEEMPAMPQPTAEHKKLLEAVGDWEGTLTHSMAGEQMPPAAAHEHIEAIGAFWTQSRFTCDMMGMPFVGTGSMGYDPAKKKYVGTWIDSMTTDLTVMEGDMDAKTNTLVMRWIGPDWTTGKPTPHRIETMFSGDSYTSSFYSGEGAGKKDMTIAMKRKVMKAGAAK